MRRSMPQIIMLSHASEISRRRLDARMAKTRGTSQETLEDAVNDSAVWNGKRVDQLTSEEYMAYHAASQ